MKIRHLLVVSVSTLASLLFVGCASRSDSWSEGKKTTGTVMLENR